MGVSIFTGGFEAEYGNALSGVVNIVTQTGSADHPNLYDEVLQAEEDISIDGTLTRAGIPGTVATAHGGRDQLLDLSLIQAGNLLTIEPESSAVFLIQWNHAEAALWEQTQMTFHTQPGNPSDFSWFESGTITLNAEGTAQLFEGVAPVQLAPTQFAISYTIWVGDPMEVQVDNFIPVYNTSLGMVRLQWQTPFEVNNYGFMVERGVSPTEFPVVYNDFIAGQGTTFDTTYYFFLDSMDHSPGLRYYRLQRWYDFGFIVWALDPTNATAVIVP